MTYTKANLDRLCDEIAMTDKQIDVVSARKSELVVKKKALTAELQKACKHDEQILRSQYNSAVGDDNDWWVDECKCSVCGLRLHKHQHHYWHSPDPKYVAWIKEGRLFDAKDGLPVRRVPDGNY